MDDTKAIEALTAEMALTRSEMAALTDVMRHASIRSTEVYAELSAGARSEYTRVMERSGSIVKVR